MAGKQALLTEGKIVSGPSKYDLMLGLFDPFPKNRTERIIPRSTDFIIAIGERNGVFKFTLSLRSVERADFQSFFGDERGDIKWILSGQSISVDRLLDISSEIRNAYFTANYNSKTRKGHIKFFNE